MRTITTTILALTLLAATPAIAQETTTTTPTTSTDATVTTTTATDATVTATAEAVTTTTPTATEGSEEDHTHQLRNEFIELLQRHPDELIMVLIYEPTLLSNQQFLNEHPELARFIAAHPEVAANARFYLEPFGHRSYRSSVMEKAAESVGIVSVFAIIAFALSWLVRTLIEQKRWTKLSRTQSEVHNKILDRFGTSGELLEYIKSPAGAKFLESAPIPLHSEPAPHSTPFTRVIWSIQIGVIVAAAALGMLLVSLRFEAEAGRELFAMGVIALCIGLGFVASAAVSIILTRRLGAWQSNDSSGETVR